MQVKRAESAKQTAALQEESKKQTVKLTSEMKRENKSLAKILTAKFEAAQDKMKEDFEFTLNS